jgi:predicted lipid-binding transport protein (Tim44 family)
VTRDADGNVIAGTLEDAVTTNDSWTFSRNLRDDDPNWLLVETDDA